MVRRVNSATLLVVAATLCILFYRGPGRLLDGYLWAEDAATFLKSGYTLGWQGVLEPYSRYVVFIPNVIATAASKHLSLDKIPYVLVWLSAAMTCGATAYIHMVARRGMLKAAHGDILAVTIALAPVLVPHSGEVFLNITNIQWILATALAAATWDNFLSPTAPERRPAMSIALGGLLMAITLTGPFGVLMWPLAALGLVVNRNTITSSRILPFVMYTIGSAYQFNVMHGPWPEDPPIAQLAWGRDFFIHYVAEAFVPKSLPQEAKFVAGIVCLTAMAAVAVSTRARLVCLAAGGIGLTLWVGAMLRINQPDVHFTWSTGGSRYMYLPFVLTAWALAIGLAYTAHGWARAACVTLLSLMALTSASGFKSDVFKKWAITEDQSGTTLTVPPGANWKVTIPPTGMTSSE